MTPEQEARIAERIADIVCQEFPRSLVDSIVLLKIASAIRAALADPILTDAIRADEREKCAKVADDYWKTKGGNQYARSSGRGVANAIRAIKD